MATLPLCTENTSDSENTEFVTVINITAIQLLNSSHHGMDAYAHPIQEQSVSTVTTISPSGAAAVAAAQGLHLGWFETILLVLCIIGVSGNVLNLLVLTRRRFCSALNQLESSANYGLVALALSDLGFCLMVLPHVFMGHLSRTNPFVMHYRLYGVATINLFLMISTWLIIIIAVNRWIVVVYPLKAKSILSQQSTVFCILMVYIASVGFTLPYYLHMSIRPCRTVSGETSYQFHDTYSAHTTKLLRLYVRWLWPIIADFIPLLTLGMCNMRLIREIRKTTNNTMATGRRSSQRNLRTAGSKVTVTLMSIILMYLILVTPCEIMKYINPYRSWGKAGFIVANVTNALQTANFAFNFVLYCLVNATFRQTLKDMVHPGRPGPSSMSVRSFSVRGESLVLKGGEKQAMLVRRNSKTFTVISNV